MLPQQQTHTGDIELAPTPPAIPSLTTPPVAVGSSGQQPPIFSAPQYRSTVALNIRESVTWWRASLYGVLSSNFFNLSSTVLTYFIPFGESGKSALLLNIITVTGFFNAAQTAKAQGSSDYLIRGCVAELRKDLVWLRHYIEQQQQRIGVHRARLLEESIGQMEDIVVAAESIERKHPYKKYADIILLLLTVARYAVHFFKQNPALGLDIVLLALNACSFFWGMYNTVKMNAAEKATLNLSGLVPFFQDLIKEDLKDQLSNVASPAEVDTGSMSDAMLGINDALTALRTREGRITHDVLHAPAGGSFRRGADAESVGHQMSINRPTTSFLSSSLNPSIVQQSLITWLRASSFGVFSSMLCNVSSVVLGSIFSLAKPSVAHSMLIVATVTNFFNAAQTAKLRGTSHYLIKYCIADLRKDLTWLQAYVDTQESQSTIQQHRAIMLKQLIQDIGHIVVAAESAEGKNTRKEYVDLLAIIAYVVSCIIYFAKGSDDALLSTAVITVSLNICLFLWGVMNMAKTNACEKSALNQSTIIPFFKQLITQDAKDKAERNPPLITNPLFMQRAQLTVNTQLAGIAAQGDGVDAVIHGNRERIISNANHR